MRITYSIFFLIISNLVMAQAYKPLEIDSKRDFKFKNEGKAVDWIDGLKMINSDVLVNNDTSTDIQFTKAKFKGDTLNIEIYQTDESHDHHYKIAIVKDRYKIDYDFSYPIDTVDRKIQTLDFKLILNTKIFRKGSIIRGYTEFKGKCMENCYDDIITAKGYFRVTVE